MGERISIYYFSSIPYDFLRQRPQQLFNAFRKGLREVDCFYVEPPHGLRGIGKKPPDPPPEGVISSPLVIPFEKLGLGRRNPINRRLVRHVMPSDPNRKKVAMVCTTAWEPFLPYNYFDLVCYDCLDALQVHAGYHADRGGTKGARAFTAAMPIGFCHRGPVAGGSCLAWSEILIGNGWQWCRC